MSVQIWAYSKNQSNTMITSKREVETKNDITLRIQNFLEIYGISLVALMFVLSNFHVGYFLLFILDTVTHLFLLSTFKNNYFGFGYSFMIWMKKFIILPMYFYTLGPNSTLPAWTMSMTQVIGLTNLKSDFVTGKVRDVCYLLLTTEIVFSMHFFADYSVQKCSAISTVTLFFVYYFINILEAVSELVNKLQEQYFRYKNLVDVISGVFIIADEKLTITFVNKGILGQKPKEILGKNLKDLPFYDSRKINQLKKTHKRQKYNWKHKDSSDNLLWYDIDLCFQFSNSKNSYEIALLIQDISLEKKMEEKEKINLQKITSLKAKNEFIASVSHEIRNPLQVISYNTENLLTKEVSQEIKESIKDIHDATKFLSTIIGDILDYSKIEAGAMKIVNQKFELLSMLENSIIMNSKNCFEKGLKMYFDFDFSLPKYCFGDASRILEVINNFITNAIKYTKEGHVQLNAKLQTDMNIEKILIECEDTGIGISKKNLKNLFDPFVQIQSEKYSPTKFKGWGLGLSICKKLLNLMNGEFGVESVLGKGTKFWMSIPIPPIEDNPKYCEILKKSEVIFNRVSIIHSDTKVVNQIVKIFQLLEIPEIEQNSINFLENQLVLAQKNSLENIPLDIFPNMRIIEITNESSKYQKLKYPILPSSLFKILLKEERKETINEIVNFNKKLNVLVVDDNTLILKSLERLLRILHVKNITTAKNGKDAFNIVNESKQIFDIIFMDISMPVMNGIEAAEMIRNLKNEKSRCLIYALTGNALMKSIDEQKIEWKMDDILSKPINKNELETILKNI